MLWGMSTLTFWIGPEDVSQPIYLNDQSQLHKVTKIFQTQESTFHLALQIAEVGNGENASNP